MKRSSSLFQRVPTFRPGRSVFNLSHNVKFTCNMGQLIPILLEDVVPGDYYKIGNEVVVRLQPLVFPILHEINIYTHYFFIPYDDLCKAAVEAEKTSFDWRSFITGGEDGDDAQSLPLWNVTSNAVGDLWDYMGMPIGIDCAGARPVIFMLWAYNWIWNYFFRDEFVDDEVDLEQEDVLRCRWEKDYFMSMRPTQQVGTAGALPVSLSGTLNIDAAAAVGASITLDQNNYLMVHDTAETFHGPSGGDISEAEIEGAFEKLTVDLSSGTATTFDIHDLRLSFAIQRWQERNALAGVRYPEFILGHFGLKPRDESLEQPVYIGGTKSPLIINEVLQTSQTDTTAQGTMAGHGIGVSQNYAGDYRVKEYGMIMGLMSIRPRTAYHQGIDRQWLKDSRYDFYFPEFAHQSEQEVYEAELYATAVEAQNTNVLGYQGAYNHMRYRKDRICGDMHADYDKCHMAIQFTARPTLSSTLLEMTPRYDCFAAPSEDTCLVNFGNIIKAVRPMPLDPIPNLM